ncbi:MAG: hypothetical protein ABJB55_07385 [Actinomycetota bacterium]
MWILFSAPCPTPDGRSAETSEGANTFSERWDNTDGLGEIAITLPGDVGLVPDP